MISIGELKIITERIEREYGSDAKVCIQARTQYGELIDGGYVNYVFTGKDGTLYISGKLLNAENIGEEKGNG